MPFAAVSSLQLPFPGSPHLRCRTSRSWTAYLDFMLSLIRKSDYQTTDRNGPDSISSHRLSDLLLHSLITRRLTAQLGLTSTPPIQDISQPASRIVASLQTTNYPCRMEPCPPLVPIQPRFWFRLPPVGPTHLTHTIISLHPHTHIHSHTSAVMSTAQTFR